MTKIGRLKVKHHPTSTVASHFIEYLSDSRMSLNSRISYGTMSCSLLSSALRGTEIEQFMSNHDQTCHDRSTLMLIYHTNIYSLLTPKRIGQHSFFGVSMLLYKGVRFIHWTSPVGFSSLLPHVLKMSDGTVRTFGSEAKRDRFEKYARAIKHKWKPTGKGRR